MSLRRLLSILLIGLLLFSSAGGALAQDPGPAQPGGGQVPLGTGFTYQGRLESGGNAYTGACGFEFGLWDALSGGAQSGITQTVSAVPVDDGFFTAQLNGSAEFDPGAFIGTARWLAIRVRCPDSGSYTDLSPRQALTAAPYALFATGNWGLNGNFGTTTANFLGTTDNVTLTLKVNGQTAFRLGPNATAVNVLGGAASNNIFTGAYGSTIGGGASSVISPSVIYATVAGGLSNRAGGAYAAVGGGNGHQADGTQSVIAGGQGNHTFGQWSAVGGGVGNNADSTYATVAGGFDNDATAAGTTIGGGRNNRAGAPGATVGGGGWTGSSADGNLAWGDGSTIAGGYGNVITPTDVADFGAIGGGGDNLVQGGYGTIAGGFANIIGNGNSYAAIGGGRSNEATAADTVVAGGNNNTASGTQSAVLGGQDNTASGSHATVLGGQSNTATGGHSVALGWGAHADQSGSLVWVCATCPHTYAGTAQAAFFNSDAGFWFGRDVAGASITPTIGAGNFISTSTGARLTTGGVWTNSSDRNAKTSFAAVDGVAILDTLMNVPIETWTYKVEDAGIRHLGPTAQDFYAAFGLGDSDISIGTVDADGVALAAIQGLYTVVQEKDAELAALRASNDALTAAQAETNARLAALEAATNGVETSRRDVSTATPMGSTVQLAIVLVAGLLAGAAIGAGAYALGRRAARQ